MKTTFVLSVIAALVLSTVAEAPHKDIKCNPSKCEATKGKLAIGEMKHGEVKPERYLYGEMRTLRAAKPGNCSVPTVQLYECSVPDNYAKYGKEARVGQLRLDERSCLTLRSSGKVEVAECAEIIDPSMKPDTLAEQWFQIAGQTVRHVGEKNSPIQDEAIMKHDNVTKLVESKGNSGKSLFIVH